MGLVVVALIGGIGSYTFVRDSSAATPSTQTTPATTTAFDACASALNTSKRTTYLLKTSGGSTLSFDGNKVRMIVTPTSKNPNRYCIQHQTRGQTLSMQAGTGQYTWTGTKCGSEIGGAGYTWSFNSAYNQTLTVPDKVCVKHSWEVRVKNSSGNYVVYSAKFTRINK